MSGHFDLLSLPELQGGGGLGDHRDFLNRDSEMRGRVPRFIFQPGGQECRVTTFGRMQQNIKPGVTTPCGVTRGHPPPNGLNIGTLFNV